MIDMNKECNVIGCNKKLPDNGITWRICDDHKYLFMYDSEQLKTMGIKFKDDYN